MTYCLLSNLYLCLIVSVGNDIIAELPDDSLQCGGDDPD